MKREAYSIGLEVGVKQGIPARTDTEYFHKFIYPYAELRFIKGRLKFGDAKGSAPFPRIGKTHIEPRCAQMS